MKEKKILDYFGLRRKRKDGILDKTKIGNILRTRLVTIIEEWWRTLSLVM